MRYYIEDANQMNGFIEVTKNEYESLFGDETTRPYVQAVYCGEMTIEDVPAEYRETVQTIVTNKINRWGSYKSEFDSYRAFEDELV